MGDDGGGRGRRGEENKGSQMIRLGERDGGEEVVEEAAAPLPPKQTLITATKRREAGASLSKSRESKKNLSQFC